MRQILCAALVLLPASLAMAEDYLHLHSVSISGDSVRVEYSKNFITCAHLYRDAGGITHYQNLFCKSGDNVVRS